MRSTPAWSSGLLQVRIAQANRSHGILTPHKQTPETTKVFSYDLLATKKPAHPRPRLSNNKASKCNRWSVFWYVWSSQTCVYVYVKNCVVSWLRPNMKCHIPWQIVQFSKRKFRQSRANLAHRIRGWAEHSYGWSSHGKMTSPNSQLIPNTSALSVGYWVLDVAFVWMTMRPRPG